MYTTGDVDDFWGGFVSKIIKSGKTPDELAIEDLAVFARSGNAVASLCVEKRRGIYAIPEEMGVANRLLG